MDYDFEYLLEYNKREQIWPHYWEQYSLSHQEVVPEQTSTLLGTTAAYSQ